MYPYVSVIIPVLNDQHHIKECLEKLFEQNYPEELFEIIVVDNGSTDNTVEVVKKFKNVKLIYEHNYKNSPYSARNRGIEVSKGEIIALLDATCYPSKYWIANGVKSLSGVSKVIVGGNVKFGYGNKITASKYYDSLINIKMKESIEEHQVCKTANMFIPKKIFYNIGFFPEGVRSGADVSWTKNATINGYKLIYDEDAYVIKAARPFLQLIKKQWRVGVNQPRIWFKFDKKISYSRYFSLRKLLPPKPRTLKRVILEKGIPDMNRYIIQFILIGFIIKITMFFAHLVGLLRLKKN